ncbi:hypothetical protein GN156_15330 [bacterium LRH843]|nr:hypothetical protein [bacterium LRH843]
MKKGILSLLFVCAIILTGCGGEQSSSSISEGSTDSADSKKQVDKPIEWNLVSFVGLQHPMGAFLAEFAEDLTERTDGRLSVTALPPGELPYAVSEYLRVTGEGSVEISDSFLPFHSGDLSIAAISDLPLLITSFDEAKVAIDEVMMPYIEEELKDHGTKLLFWYPWPEQNIWGKGDPVTEISDLANLKLRTQSPEQSSFLVELNANPVALDSPEIPSAVSTGVIDGVITASLNIMGSQWHEFTDWGFFINFLIPPSYIVVNEEAYESLPEDIQGIVDAVSAEYQEKLGAHISQIENDYKEQLINEHEIEIIDATDEQMNELLSRFSPYWDEWASKQEPHVQEVLQKVRDVLSK